MGPGKCSGREGERLWRGGCTPARRSETDGKLRWPNYSYLGIPSYGTDKYADKLELYADKRGWHNIFAKARRAHQRALEALAA